MVKNDKSTEAYNYLQSISTGKALFQNLETVVCSGTGVREVTQSCSRYSVEGLDDSKDIPSFLSSFISVERKVKGVGRGAWGAWTSSVKVDDVLNKTFLNKISAFFGLL